MLCADYLRVKKERRNIIGDAKLNGETLCDHEIDASESNTASSLREVSTLTPPHPLPTQRRRGTQEHLKDPMALLSATT
jgi:hypothetical protein